MDYANNVIVQMVADYSIYDMLHGMRYPSSFVDQVKHHFRLSEVISRYVPLKRHGREYHACCPFHQENTPSFTVNDEKGFYHCFGCKASGDAITFVMEHLHLSYPEAITTLAQQAGIPVPVPDKQTQERYDHEAVLLKVMDAAHSWFMRQLRCNTGEEAKAYVKQRGISDDVMETFGIGYAPARRDGLKQELQQQGISESQMVECGLLIQVEGKPTYDRFRDRVMFPIRRMDGKIIAFGGRLLKPHERAPKYLNSPETSLFKKQDVLFNMDRVRRTLHETGRIIVVEGYTDAISLHAAGITSAVAPLGTAFTESHLQQLWRYHANPVLCFDGDKAGQRAMLRAADLALPLIRADQLVQFCILPEGEDPDSYIQQKGRAAFEGLLKNALSMSDVLWNVFVGNRHFPTPEMLAGAESKLMQSVNSVTDQPLKKRIIQSYKDRLWHLSRKQHQPSAPSNPAKAQVTSVAAKVPFQLMDQMFALFMLYPSLMQEAETEQLLYDLDWSKTYCSQCINHIVSGNMEDYASRDLAQAYLQQHFSDISHTLQEHYTRFILPTHVCTASEAEGRGLAKSLLARLCLKLQQGEVHRDLEYVSQMSQESNNDAQLLELIKMQQEVLRNTSNTVEDPYI